ncbi:MAG: hypothetical protein QM479_12390 [Pseudomonadota bacterium]
MIDFFTLGIALALSAGFAPGPLLTLVISETLQHDIKAGIKVAFAPIITDFPIMIKALSLNSAALLVFVFSFYSCLAGAKILLALVVGKSKSFLSNNIYIYIVRVLGLVLCILALILFRDGFELLGILSF